MTTALSNNDGGMIPDHQVHLRFLGAPVVEHDGERRRGFESRKAMALLGYLAVHGEAVPRSQLAELFWEGQSETRGRGNLRRELHTLTAALPGCLLIERQNVQFAHASAYWVDVIAFEGLAFKAPTTHDDIALMARAAALYRGEFMAGLFLDDCTEFEAWLATERERWQQRMVQTLTTLIARTAEQHEWALSLQFVDRLLTLDPWQEAAHRQKMTLLAHMGQRAAALAQYETCRRMLRDEIGVDPSAKTTELYAHIRAGRFDLGAGDAVARRGQESGPVSPAPSASVSSVTKSSAPPHNLPTPPTPLLGRDDALNTVKALLLTPACRLVTLVGPPGIGKTRLSLQVASELTNRFEDGVRFVDLAPVTDPGLVVDVIARALGIQELASRPLFESLQAHLQHKRLLLLLDNFEQVLTGASQVAALLAAPGCEGLTVLVTSRAALRLRGEHEFELHPLALPSRLSHHRPHLATLIQNPAVALFTQRAQAVKSSFALTEENADAVAEICARLDGLPLAIELAAARIKLLTPQAMLNRLSGASSPAGSSASLQLLTGGARDLPPRQHTLRTAIAWSYDLLSPVEQRLFQRLGVFMGGWTLETAEAVGGVGPLRREEVLEGLASLLDKSLVRQSQNQAGEARFGMLETIREFAQEQLGAGDEAEAIRQEHAQVFLHWAEEQAARIPGPEQIAALNTLEAEHDNLRAALRWCLQSKAVGDAIGDGLDADAALVGLNLSVAVAQLWFRRAYLREGRDWLELALSETSGDTPKRADALLMAGYFAFRQGDHAAARTLESHSLALWRRLGDRHGVACCLTALSYIAVLASDYDSARDMLTESIPVLRNGTDTLTLAIALHILGLSWYQTGDLGRASVLFDESLILMRASGDVSWIALPLSGAGRVAYGQGDLEAAQAKLEEALSLLEAAGDRPQMASTLYWLGQVARLQGKLNLAARRYIEGLTLADEVAVKAIVPNLLEGLAGVSIARGAEGYRLAVRLLGAAEALRIAINLPLAQVNRDDFDRTMAALHAGLNGATFAAEWAKGQAMPLRQAIDDAISMSSWTSHDLA